MAGSDLKWTLTLTSRRWSRVRRENRFSSFLLFCFYIYLSICARASPSSPRRRRRQRRRTLEKQDGDRGVRDRARAGCQRARAHGAYDAAAAAARYYHARARGVVRIILFVVSSVKRTFACARACVAVLVKYTKLLSNFSSFRRFLHDFPHARVFNPAQPP